MECDSHIWDVYSTTVVKSGAPRALSNKRDLVVHTGTFFEMGLNMVLTMYSSQMKNYFTCK